MQQRGRLFDDLAQLMTNAMGVAQGARDEFETAVSSWFDRWVAERNLVSRDEFDAVRLMAQKAREENETLRTRLEELEAMVGRAAESESMSTSKKICPECGHVFQGKGWEGIDAHWQSSHEEIMPYEKAWPLIKSGKYVKHPSS